jgi:hypothetical protein
VYCSVAPEVGVGLAASCAAAGVMIAAPVNKMVSAALDAVSATDDLRFMIFPEEQWRPV